MWRKRRPEVHPRDIDAFGKLQFKNCATESSVFHRMPLYEILAAVRDAVAED
jgi:hypothetical protein